MNAFRFECTRCGQCCRRPGVVALRADELATIARHRGISVDALVRDYDIEPQEDAWWINLRDEPCPFLVDDECSVNEVKPRQCRTYPFWPEVVETFDTWDGEREHCPGIGRGPEWSDSQIQEMLEMVDR